MQLTLSHLGTNRETIQVNMLHASKLTGVHQSACFSKVHNSVKLDVRSLEWDDTRCATYAWGTLDHNRKFSEIKCSKMLKLVHNLQCRSNFAERALLLDSSGQNSPISQSRWLHWRLLLINKSKICHLATPPLKKAELSFYGVYQPVHVHCKAKKLRVHSCNTFQVTCPMATSDAMLRNRLTALKECKSLFSYQRGGICCINWWNCYTLFPAGYYYYSLYSRLKMQLSMPMLLILG